MKVRLVYNRIPHHAGRSGYDQLGRYLATRIELDTLEGDVPRLIPWPVWDWFVRRYGESVARRAGKPWYDPYSLGLEIRAAKEMLHGRNEIYHILYGENTYRYLGLAGAAAKRRHSAIVATYHQPPQALETTIGPKSILRRLTAIVVVASNQATYFSSLVGEGRVHVVPHGIDTEYFRPGTRGTSQLTSCLCVGRWLRDFEILRRVIKCVGAVAPEVRFRIVGSGDGAEKLAELSNATIMNQLSDDELLATYQSSDLLVLPLTDCTANNALLEGMACGLPVVTTDVGGIRDYIDETCSMLVRPGDADSMVDAILALNADNRLRREMGEHSRMRALKCDWNHVADKLVDLYREVAA